MNLSVSTTPEGIADLVRDLARQSDSTDFREVTEAIEEINKGRARAALRGTTLLELPKARGRCFILAYLGSNGRVRTARGIEFVEAKQAEDDEDTPRRCNSVLIDDRGHSFYGRYETMDELRNLFKNAKMPYHIEYAD